MTSVCGVLASSVRSQCHRCGTRRRGPLMRLGYDQLIRGSEGWMNATKRRHSGRGGAQFWKRLKVAEELSVLEWSSLLGESRRQTWCSQAHVDAVHGWGGCGLWMDGGVAGAECVSVVCCQCCVLWALCRLERRRSNVASNALSAALSTAAAGCKSQHTAPTAAVTQHLRLLAPSVHTVCSSSGHRIRSVLAVSRAQRAARVTATAWNRG